MKDILKDISEWQENNPAFAKATVATSIQHLASELGELASALGISPYVLLPQIIRGARKTNGDKATEIADIFIMLVDVSRRAGIDVDRCEQAVRDKHAVNLARSWQTSVGGIIEHKEPSK